MPNRMTPVEEPKQAFASNKVLPYGAEVSVVMPALVESLQQVEKTQVEKTERRKKEIQAILDGKEQKVDGAK